MNTFWQLLFLVIAFGLGYETKARLEPWLAKRKAYKRRVVTRRSKRQERGIPDSIVIDGKTGEGEANAQDNG